MAQTTVQNVSGATKFFGFLPPHGLTLDNAETVTFDGDLRTILGAGGGGGRYNRKREITALQEACDAGEICLTEVAETCCSSGSL
jgi:hypothetical protein